VSEAPNLSPKPTPNPENQLDEEFWRHCADERLCFQVCGSCNLWRHLPRWFCARCGSPNWSWKESSGRGQVYTWTVTHQASLPQFASDAPYIVAVVELEEGVRMVSRLRGVAPEALAIGLPVGVEFEQVAEGFALPMFRPR
jgi:uncharacterized OB-fold protein